MSNPIFSSTCPVCGQVEEADAVFCLPSFEMWGKQGHSVMSISTTIHGRQTVDVCDACLSIGLEALLELIKNRPKPTRGKNGKSLESQS